MILQEVRTCHPQWSSIMTQKTGVHRHCTYIAAKLWTLQSLATLTCDHAVFAFFGLCLQLHFSDLLIIWQFVCVAELWWLRDILSGYWEPVSVDGGSPPHHRGLSWHHPWEVSTAMSVIKSTADRLYLLHCNHVRQHKEWNLQNHNFTWCFMWGVKLGLLHWGKNIGWGCWRVECWGGYLGVSERKWQVTVGDCTVGSVMILLLPGVIRVMKQGRKGRQCMWHMWGRSEMHTGFWQGKLKECSCKTKALVGGHC